ncbi:MAG: M20/M25/M40 family metallo-hydrolase [Flavobacteriaceae bacterium]
MAKSIFFQRFFIVFLLNFFAFPTHLKSQSISVKKMEQLAEEKFPDALSNLTTFLRLPNNGNFPDQVQENLEYCDSIFRLLNFKTQVLETPGAPLLFAEKLSSKKDKTILFYLQIDGQPVDTLEWDQADPFDPVIKSKAADGQWKKIPQEGETIKFDPEFRIFARSASDSKGPAMAFISALQILKAQGLHPQFNIKVIMDFQEELGSPHLPEAVKNHKKLLVADYLLIMDGTRHLSNWPTITYGARGIATASLRIFGPKTPLHSGQYGNFAPNPIFEASKLIGSLKDASGRVTLPGFYDGIKLSEKEKTALNSLPENEDSLKLRLGISKADRVGASYQEALQYPTLNIRGLRSAWVGKEVRTVIPDEMLIEFDLRLVPESDGERLIGLLRKHIVNQGYHLVDSIPTEKERQDFPKLANFKYRLGSLPFRTNMDSELGRYLNKAMEKVFGKRVVNMRSTGGSQPVAPFVHSLGVPAVSIRIPNPDNSIHAPNENLRFGNYLEGILMCLAILNQPTSH